MDSRSAGERVRGLLLQATVIVIVVLVALMVVDLLTETVEPVAGTAAAGD